MTLYTLQHTLLEQEAESTRTAIIDMVQRVRPFIDEISDTARRLSEVIQQIEGGMRCVEDLDGIAEPRHVSNNHWQGTEGQDFLMKHYRHNKTTQWSYTKIKGGMRCIGDFDGIAEPRHVSNYYWYGRKDQALYWWNIWYSKKSLVKSYNRWRAVYRTWLA